jgi:uncharacterized membrane protein
MAAVTDQHRGRPGPTFERSAPEPRSTVLRDRLNVWVPFALVAVGLLGGTWLRLVAIFSKHQMEHDEAVTYLAATGHMAAFQRARYGGLAGHWVPATQWKKLLSPGPFWSFGRIASGLARYDEHPPLHFWLLHVWIFAFGMTLRTGAVLNVLIAATTCLCLFGFACYVLASRWQAAFVAVVWVLSPATITTSYMARHYDLFALVTVCCLWLFALCSDTQRRLTWRLLVLLGLASAAGWLTHYQFALVLIAGCGLAVLRLAHHERRRLGLLLVAVLVGLLATAAINPLFLVAVRNQRVQDHVASTRLEQLRIENATVGLTRFFVYDKTSAQGRNSIEALNRWLAIAHHLRYSAVAVMCLVALAVWLFVRLRLGRRLAASMRSRDPGVAVPAYYLVAVGGLTVGMYLAFQSPLYAIAPRYLAAVWPFVAFVPVLVGRLLRRWAVIIAFVICLAVILPNGIHDARASTIPRVPVGEFAMANRVVLFNEERGNLLPVIWDLPPRVRVFVLPQANTYHDPSPWLDALRPGDVFVSIDGAMLSKLRAHVLEVLRGRFTLVLLKGKVNGAFQVYRLEASH